MNLDPYKGINYLWLGLSHLALGEEKEAYESFNDGIKSQKNFPWNYDEVAKILTSAGCIDDAKKVLSVMASLGDDHSENVALEKLDQLVDQKNVNCNLP